MPQVTDIGLNVESDAAHLALGGALDEAKGKCLEKSDDYVANLRLWIEKLIVRINGFGLHGELRRQILETIRRDTWWLRGWHPSPTELRRLGLLRTSNGFVMASNQHDINVISHAVICDMGCYLMSASV